MTPVIGYVLLVLATAHPALIFNIGTYPNGDQCNAAKAEYTKQANRELRKSTDAVCVPMPSGTITRATTPAHND